VGAPYPVCATFAARAKSPLRDRQRVAWDVLRSDHADSRVGVVLDPVKACAIAATLSEFADSAGIK
jgi:hypothetical protein